MVVVYLILIVIVIMLLFGINLIIATSKPDLEKVSPYECGYAPIYSQTRNPITIQYYLVALLFLAFDLEVIMLFPLAFEMATLSDYNYWVVCLFYSVLTFGFVFELGKGVIEYTGLESSL